METTRRKAEKERVGLSLPPALLLGEETKGTRPIIDAFGSADAALDALLSTCDCVEIRSVGRGFDSERLASAVRVCLARGLFVTVHATLEDVSAEEFFRPYMTVLSEGLLPALLLTVHPLGTVEDTVRVLGDICAYAEEKGYAVHIALENQRNRDDVTKNGLCRHVYEVVTRVSSPLLGLCFDFGHRMANIAREPDSDPIPDGFFALVRHTHIHSLYEGVTHYPLSMGKVKLEEVCTALRREGYAGIYNIELEPNRYHERFSVKDGYLSSVSVMRIALHQLSARDGERMRYEEEYPSILDGITRALDAHDGGLALWLLAPASYVIATKGVRIGVDPSLWDLPISKQSEEKLLSLLSGLDAVIVTHAHSDHYDASLLKRLPPRVKILMPPFLSGKIPGSHEVHEGQTLTVGDVDITFLESAHRTVPEYGFFLTHLGQNYVFPTDVRDYEAPTVHPPRTRALFTHLWLGATDALLMYDNPIVEKYRAFVRAYDADEVYAEHLFDFRRTIEQMWTEEHVKYVEGEGVSVTPLRMGDGIAFDSVKGKV